MLENTIKMSDNESVEAGNVVEDKEAKRKALKRKLALKESSGSAKTVAKKGQQPFFDNISEIKNKMKRGEKFAKLKKEKKKVQIPPISNLTLTNKFFLFLIQV